VGERYVGPPFRAIALNIGGVEFYRPKKGLANITYVAPWAPTHATVHSASVGPIRI